MDTILNKVVAGNRDGERWCALLVMSFSLCFCLIFNVMIFSAPVFAHIGQQRAAFFNYFLFSPLCHQLPERSFSMLGYPLAACARCTGIYLGFFIGLLLLLNFYDRRLKEVPEAKLFYFSCIPIAVDFLLNIFRIYTSPAFLRASTGFIMGMVLPFYIIPGIVEIVSHFAFRKSA